MQQVVTQKKTQPLLFCEATQYLASVCDLNSVTGKNEHSSSEELGGVSVWAAVLVSIWVWFGKS